MEKQLYQKRGRILLIFPPTSCHFGSGNSKGGGISLNALVPPLGLLYIASSLQRKGYEIEIVDFTIEPFTQNKLNNLIKDRDLVGISVLGENRQSALQMASAIKQINPFTYILLGGPDITMKPELPDDVDAIVLGEAENEIVAIVDHLLSGIDLAECKGIIYRNRATGEITQTSSPLSVTNLDAIDFSARGLVNHDRYTAFAPFFRGKWASIITSRGCPFGCIFCAWPSSKFQRYRFRSSENVTNEIQTIYDAGFRFLYIVDPNFLGNPDRACKIADEIIKRGIELRITILGRVDSAEEILYSKLKKAGVRIIGFGLESGHQDTLDFLRKGTTVEQNRYAVKLTDENGMYSHGHFMIGVPTETAFHIEQTISFAKSIPLDTVFFIYSQ